METVPVDESDELGARVVEGETVLVTMEVMEDMTSSGKGCGCVVYDQGMKVSRAVPDGTNRSVDAPVEWDQC